MEVPPRQGSCKKMPTWLPPSRLWQSMEQRKVSLYPSSSVHQFCWVPCLLPPAAAGFDCFFVVVPVLFCYFCSGLVLASSSSAVVFFSSFLFFCALFSSLPLLLSSVVSFLLFFSCHGLLLPPSLLLLVCSSSPVFLSYCTSGLVAGSHLALFIFLLLLLLRFFFMLPLSLALLQPAVPSISSSASLLIACLPACLPALLLLHHTNPLHPTSPLVQVSTRAELQRPW